MDDVDPIRAFDAHFEWSNELYRAIGRLIVQFEWLCDSLRTAIADLVWLDRTTHATPVLVVLGDTQPGGLLIRFRSLLATLDWLDPDDRPIHNSVCRRVERVIEERNTVVHGMWFFQELSNRTQDGRAPVQRIRFTPGGPKSRFDMRSPEEVHELADEAKALARLVGAIGQAEVNQPLHEWLDWDEDGTVKWPAPSDDPS